MGEQVFKSPGVYSQEIDLSFTGPKEPFGTPAGVVGTAERGPAFVPVTLASFKDFVDTFGKVDGKSFGAYAIQEWLRNAQSAVFVRVLGAGDGKQRESSASDSTSNNGRVNNAGFVVGGGTVIETNLNNQLNRNRDLASDAVAAGADGRGRVYFLGALHSESAGSTYFSDASKQDGVNAVPVVRGVLFAASGTLLALSASSSGSLAAGGTTEPDYSAITGTVNLADSTFVLHVSGQVSTATDYPRWVTASFNTSRADYFGKVFNKNALGLKDHGYMLYESFDISNVLATVTGTNVVEVSGSGVKEQSDIAFIMSGATAHNAGTANVPNYENYEDRFTTPTSPYVISQKFGGAEQDLFYVESTSDGVYANDKYKISIANIKRSTTDEADFGSFTLLVRDFNDTDDSPLVLEQFANLNLDRLSDNYIARRVGDKKVKFDFDQLEGSQKLLVEGEYDNVSRLIRVVPSALLKDGGINESALPMGFRGIKHLVTSGSSTLQGNLLAVTPVESNSGNITELLSGAFQPPIPMRKSIAVGTGAKQEPNRKLYWGVQFNRPVNVSDINKGNKLENIAAYTRYFGNESLIGLQSPLTASDTFCNNKFSLENIQVVTSSGGGPADHNRLTEWAYKRDGSAITTAGTRSFDPSKDLNKNTNVAKFTFILQGGFDGANIFNTEFNEFQEGAAVKEADISALQVKGATIGTYRRAIDIMSNPDDVDISLLVVPGQTEPLVTDYAIEKTEERFDAMYIMDPRLLDSNKNTVTGSSQNVSVAETANDHATRGLNTNFAASYFPGTTIFDSVNNRLVDVPSSVSVLGAFGFNDKVAQPWFAAAGFNRGALGNVVGTRVSLNLNDRDTLQNVNLNPIATFVGKGAVIFGQKTLQQRQSALDRVNVRRLLIELRRAVRNVSNLILFEPNRAATLQRFTSLINPILERIKSQAGVERFKVVVDETTTSAADVENNVIRGKIFVQPTKTVEVIALDFIVTNQGATF